MAVGAVPNGLDSDNRCYFAYPGIEYNIQVAVVGGKPPYSYSLSGQPPWMSINSTTGVISGTPTDVTLDDDSSITVSVIDAESTTNSQTFGVDVTTSGWFFVDAVNGQPHSTNGGTGTGTLANPWKTLDDVYDGSTANSRVYFKTGTYTPANLPQDSISFLNQQNGEHRVQWNNGSRSVQWLAYPGNTPTIDYLYTGSGYPYDVDGPNSPRFVMTGDVIYLDGITTTRSMTMCFQFSRNNRRGVHIRRCNFGVHGPGISSGNSAHLMWQQLFGSGGVPGTQAYGDIVYGNTFTDLKYIATSGNNCSLKMYSMWRPLVANNTFSNSEDGSEAVVAIKSDITEFDVRQNTFSNIGGLALGGNMHQIQDPTSGEIRFNLVLSAGVGSAQAQPGALRLNQDGQASAIYTQRNTFIARVHIEDVVTANGVFTISENVIVNSDSAQTPWSYITDTNITDASRVSESNNLKGVAADNITDANGDLQGTYLTNYGPNSANPRGHMLSSSSPTDTTPRRYRFKI